MRHGIREKHRRGWLSDTPISQGVQVSWFFVTRIATDNGARMKTPTGYSDSIFRKTPTSLFIQNKSSKLSPQR
jgi:hypothetical protein